MIMIRGVIYAGLLVIVGCQSGAAFQSLTLGFGSYEASPAVLTHFSIEQPLAPTPVSIVASSADIPGVMGGRTNGASILSVPRDANGDGVWTISAQWVELLTDKAWRASVDVPIDMIRVDMNAAMIGVIFGPNGELLITSDAATPDPSGYRDVGRTCGARVPEADRAWRRDTNNFPEVGVYLDRAERPLRSSFCSGNNEG